MMWQKYLFSWYSFYSFINSKYLQVFPCNECASDFQQVLHDTPPKLESRYLLYSIKNYYSFIYIILYSYLNATCFLILERYDLSLWMCQAHNHVNERLGKEPFDCKKVDERWRYEINK